jgi:hypothetical protein
MKHKEVNNEFGRGPSSTLAILPYVTLHLLISMGPNLFVPDAVWRYLCSGV